MKNTPWALAIFCTLTLSSMANARPYEPPIGIPMPSFGIEETNSNFSIGGNYKDSGHGPYTHLVDNQDPNCSNSGPATRAVPLCDIPMDTANAGMIVEIHGGPYDFGGGIDSITSNGNSSNFVIYRGVDNGNGLPVLRDMSRLEIYGSYLIIENLIFDKALVFLEGDHLALRNSEVKNHPSKNGVKLRGNDLVLYNNEIHHLQGPDKHGTTISGGSRYIWILDNYYHHNGGQGIQFCHGCDTNPPEYIFIGRNLSHSNRENGFATKFGNYYVFSQNTIHSHVPAEKNKPFYYDDGTGPTTASSGSDGTCLTIGADGTGHDMWVIYNKIYDCSKGLRIEEAKNGFAIGNVIYNSKRGIEFQKTGKGPNVVAFNTVYGVETGLEGPFQGGDLELSISDNIFALVSDKSINLYQSVVASMSSLNNNLFYNPGGSVDIVWDKSDTLNSGNQIDFLTSGTGNIVGDPGFIDPNNSDFRISDGQSGAQAQADNLLATLDTQYKATFGNDLTILVDFDGKNRGVGAQVNSLGAFEASDKLPAPPQACLPPNNDPIILVN